MMITFNKRAYDALKRTVQTYDTVTGIVDTEGKLYISAKKGNVQGEYTIPISSCSDVGEITIDKTFIDSCECVSKPNREFRNGLYQWQKIRGRKHYTIPEIVERYPKAKPQSRTDELCFTLNNVYTHATLQFATNKYTAFYTFVQDERTEVTDREGKPETSSMLGLNSYIGNLVQLQHDCIVSRKDFIRYLKLFKCTCACISVQPNSNVLTIESGDSISSEYYHKDGISLQQSVHILHEGTDGFRFGINPRSLLYALQVLPYEDVRIQINTKLGALYLQDAQNPTPESLYAIDMGSTFTDKDGKSILYCHIPATTEPITEPQQPDTDMKAITTYCEQAYDSTDVPEVTATIREPIHYHCAVLASPQPTTAIVENGVILLPPASIPPVTESDVQDLYVPDTIGFDMLATMLNRAHSDCMAYQKGKTMVWVGGNTKPIKEKLKEMGFKWAPSKGEWWVSLENFKYFLK